MCVYAASAAAAGVRRPAFRRVGRGRKAFVSIRALAQDPAAVPNAPPEEVIPAGMLPAECAAGTCSKLWVSGSHSSSSSSTRACVSGCAP
jgi:hypothetical protein